MDHTAVVREKMTERYLLNELGSDIRDQFEDTTSIARNVRSMFARARSSWNKAR